MPLALLSPPRANDALIQFSTSEFQVVVIDGRNSLFQYKRHFGG